MIVKKLRISQKNLDQIRPFFLEFFKIFTTCQSDVKVNHFFLPGANSTPTGTGSSRCSRSWGSCRGRASFAKPGSARRGGRKIRLRGGRGVRHWVWRQGRRGSRGYSDGRRSWRNIVRGSKWDGGRGSTCSRLMITYLIDKITHSAQITQKCDNA